MFVFFQKRSRNFFSQEQKDAIVKAIQAAEKNTSGEIRVHIEDRCFKKDVMNCALKIFKKLNMHKTEQRNAVLFYLTLRSKRFAIVGDEGIDKVVPVNFWKEVKNLLAEYYKQGLFDQGLIAGITLTGEKLKEYFPYQEEDINELPDDLSFS
jgi:uncharacterized membrane protein